MADVDEDPYAVSSDSDDENSKKPPPKIAIEGRTGDLKQIKEALKTDEKKSVKDEKMLEEIEALRREKAEEMSRMKRDFEEGRAGGVAQIQKESLEADHQKIKNNFERTAEDEEKQKDCCICSKVVYPVEKIWVGKQLYHTNCFKCSKCGKKLSQNAFNSHKGVLYCKPHMLEVLHPDRVGQFAAEELDDTQMDEENDDEFAVSSKPKQLASDVVRAGGTNIGDELAQLKSSLKDKKESWQSSATAGAQTSAVDEEEKRRQLEEIKGSVSEVKQKWKTGDVEGANLADDAAKQEELEALKKGVNVKQRFQPPSGGDVQKCYDRSELDTSAISDARKSFIEGSAFTSPKTESSAAGELSELKFTEMNAFKDKFEKGKGDVEEIEKAKIELDLQLKELKKTFEKPESEMSPEERAAKKKVEIEAEFARYKLARKLQAKKAKEEAEGNGGGGDEEHEEGGFLAGAGRANQISGQSEGEIQTNRGTGTSWDSTAWYWSNSTEDALQMGQESGRTRRSCQQTRRRRRFRDGRGVRCEESDGKVQEYSYDGTKGEGEEFGGIGSFEVGSEEFERTIREDESNGIEREERREEETNGGRIQATQRETSPFCPSPTSTTKLMDNKASAASALRLFSAFLTGLAIGLLLVPRIFGR
uniref:LIM zinc-binding domain-containing protein n=1 Tax=Meloidogyne floridensis TaxID=298350 RepID=A0A915NVE7_9BILA